MKLKIAVIVSLTVIALAAAALADPIICNEKAMAWLGENGYLHLQDASGRERVLRSPVGDLLGMNDTRLVFLTAEGRLYSVGLNGGGMEFISVAPTAEELVANVPAAAFELEGGVLSVPDGDSMVHVAEGVEAACTGRDELFYAAGGTVSSILLKGDITDIMVLGSYTGTCWSMYASYDSVAMITDEGTVVVYDLNGGADEPVVGDMPAYADAAVSVGGALYLYNRINGLYQMTYAGSNGVADGRTQLAAAAAVPASTPTPTPIPKPRSKATVTHAKDYVEGAINYGDHGKKVTQMQTRLAELGYPVGKIDGRYGDDTLLAVKLFQHNIGYKERSAVLKEVQEILYSDKAPVFDPTAPLTKGDEGAPVTRLQKALKKAGYLKNINDKYDTATAEAVFHFQRDNKLFGSGVADRETQEKLFGIN